MDSISMKIEGLDELEKAFKDVVRKYPDRAGDLLRKEGFKLRGNVVKLVRNDTDTLSQSKMSLGKTSSYKISDVKGYGAGQYVEVSAKSPHFHLLENGHRLTNKDGKPVGQGFVPGYHFMDRSSRKAQVNMPQTVETMIDKILKEEGLI